MNLPSEKALEYAVIGYALAEGAVGAGRILNLVPSEALFFDDCRQAVLVIQKLVADGQPVDTLVFDAAWKEMFKSRAPVAILDSANHQAAAPEVDAYCEKIMEAWDRRRIIMAGDALMRGAQDGTKDVAKLLEEADAQIRRREHRTLPQLGPPQCQIAFIDGIDRRMALNGARSGIETGFYRLDDITDGLQFGEQTVIGARPSIGKTALVCNIVNHCCLKNDVPTLFISLEMSPEALMNRMFSAHDGVPLQKIKRGRIEGDHIQDVARFALTLKRHPIWICNAIKGITTSQLSAIWRYHARVNGVKLVVLDYLQKVLPDAKHEKRTYEVAQVSNALKGLASETGCAFISVCQLNREIDKDRRRRMPKPSDLSDSGQIERDADCIIMMSRDVEKTPGEAQLVVCKQRDGEVGLINLQFQPEFCRFVNPAPENDADHLARPPQHEPPPELPTEPEAQEIQQALPYKDE